MSVAVENNGGTFSTTVVEGGVVRCVCVCVWLQFVVIVFGLEDDTYYCTTTYLEEEN